MCLTINLWSTKKTAKKDIRCYKILVHRDSKYHSPYMTSSYGIGETKSSALAKPVYAGFPWFWQKEVEEGLHSFAKYSDAVIFIKMHGWFGMKICNAIIPRGSEYYAGRFGFNKSYASNKLRVIGEVVRSH